MNGAMEKQCIEEVGCNGGKNIPASHRLGSWSQEHCCFLFVSFVFSAFFFFFEILTLIHISLRAQCTDWIRVCITE